MRHGARLVILDQPFRGLDRETRRALLARARRWWRAAPLILPDESFAALDPESLRIALDCVLRRAKWLLGIGHP